jgi:hypothetical protein
MIQFGGNCTASVTKQGRYSVRYQDGSPVVSVVMETSDGIRVYPATRSHEQLVEMVNAIKTAASASKGGSFYINEYRQVIVPAGTPLGHYYAGEYHEPISLVMESTGQEFSGSHRDASGRVLSPRDSWGIRPRPGIAYTLSSGGQDIYYERKISVDAVQKVRLSSLVGVNDAVKTASRIAKVKGKEGGRFYVNDFRVIFGPRSGGADYLFMGLLDESDPWFPKWLPQDGQTVTPTKPILFEEGARSFPRVPKNRFD